MSKSRAKSGGREGHLLPPELQSCPCCDSSDIYAGRTGSLMMGVVCNGCGLAINRVLPQDPPEGLGGDTPRDREDALNLHVLKMAVAAWNQRLNPPSPGKGDNGERSVAGDDHSGYRVRHDPGDPEAAREYASLASNILTAAVDLTQMVTKLSDGLRGRQVEEEDPAKKTRSPTMKGGAESHPGKHKAQYFREGTKLVRIRYDHAGGVVQRLSCEHRVAVQLIEEMIKQGGMEQNINTHKILKDKGIAASAMTPITDWLNHIEMIRRMQGAYRLRKCEPHTFRDVIEERFAALPELHPAHH